MSLILEALKKSEAKRRLGAAPDLGTPFAARRRRSPIVPIVVVVLVAAALVWWVVRRPAPELPVQKTSAQSAVAPVPPSLTGQRTGAPLRSVTGDNSLQQVRPPANLTKQTTTSGSQDPFVATGPANANNDGAARAMKEMRDRRRANANRGDNSAIAAGAARPMLPKPQPVTPSNAPAVATAPPRPAPVAAAPPTPQPAATVAAAPTAVQPMSPKTSDANPPAAQVATRAPKSPGTIGLPVNPPPAEQNTPAKQAPGASAQPYSELPFSVRKALPELRLSMHVYASDPAQRFVVLNDSRIGEGDKTTDDVFVREIRPDGVVLEFQGQRFFYPRDGL